MQKINKKLILLILPVTLILLGIFLVATTNAAAVPLGTATNFGVLANTAVNNAGISTVNGDLGISPSTTINDAGTLTVNGTTHLNDVTAITAQADLATAYTNAATQTPDATIVGDLGGQTFTPGVYNSGSSIGLTGTVILDAQGDPDATFVFQAGSTLTTATVSTVSLINGAQACNVFWQVGSSATLGTNNTFRGNILAAASITVTTGTTIDGRLLARDAAVTLGTNIVTLAECQATLNVIKHVVNDNGGVLTASNFNMHVTLGGTDVAGSPAGGAESPGVEYLLDSGTYVVSEDANSGYTATYSGDCNSSGSITLDPGETGTCTITNNDIQPTLTVIKQVINDSGGSTLAAGFNMHVTLSGTDVAGSPSAGVESPGTTFSLSPGAYVVSEDPNSSYTATFSGDCNSSGNVSLAIGENKTCTVTNNDIGATLHVIKHVINDDDGISGASDFDIHVELSGVEVSGSPAVGAESPGTQYNLSAGTYVISEETFTGYDATFSGDCDTNGNITLTLASDRTCTITNDDIDSEVPVINIVVNADQMNLPEGGGPVTFTYTVTNPSVVPISSIVVTDSGCSSVTYVSGDTSSDTILDPSETWIFTCSTTVTTTTQNTVTVSGSGNSIGVTDNTSITITVASAGGVLPITNVSSGIQFLIMGFIIILLGFVTYKYNLGRDTMQYLIDTWLGEEQKVVKRELGEMIR